MENKQMRNLNETFRDEMIMKDRILKIIKDRPKTIPEIAESLGSPSHEVMYWVMAMWRYGKIIETGKANKEGYFSYKPKE